MRKVVFSCSKYIKMLKTQTQTPSPQAASSGFPTGACQQKAKGPQCTTPLAACSRQLPSFWHQWLDGKGLPGHWQLAVALPWRPVSRQQRAPEAVPAGSRQLTVGSSALVPWMPVSRQQKSPRLQLLRGWQLAVPPLRAPVSRRERTDAVSTCSWQLAVYSPPSTSRQERTSWGCLSWWKNELPSIPVLWVQTSRHQTAPKTGLARASSCVQTPKGS